MTKNCKFIFYVKRHTQKHFLKADESISVSYAKQDRMPEFSVSGIDDMQLKETCQGVFGTWRKQ